MQKPIIKISIQVNLTPDQLARFYRTVLLIVAWLLT
jgi:hypothetical protein